MSYISWWFCKYIFNLCLNDWVDEIALSWSGRVVENTIIEAFVIRDLCHRELVNNSKCGSPFERVQ